jgi:YesN/AraC family two-component response regulator
VGVAILSTELVKTVVVDDEARIRRGIERLVTTCSEEFQVIGSFASGNELLDVYHRDQLEFDLLITDIRMPGLDGLELIKELKNYTSFEAVVISGYNDFKYLQTAIREGAVDYMVKPIIREEFRQQLHRVKEKIFHKRLEEERLIKLNLEFSHMKRVETIIQSLELKKFEEAVSLLNQFLDEIEYASSEEIERSIQSLAVQIVNHIGNHTIVSNETDFLYDAINLTKRAGNFKVIRYTLSEWMQNVYLSLNNLKNPVKADPIQTAKQWIIENLADNITIEKIAREIPMNPTYFSEYFKNQTGETVLDFVTRTRIEKARELLFLTDLKVYDIAEKVGYTDTKYFSKLFKKYFGEVPSKYKEKIKYG